jgi:hypothetical protein
VVIVAIPVGSQEPAIPPPHLRQPAALCCASQQGCGEDGMSDQTPVLLTIWEIAVEAGREKTTIDIVSTAQKVAAKHADSGLSFKEICDLVERAAAKRGVPVRRESERLVA